jgi:HAD superfamily hydrolase (TIGR01509 family)
MDDKGCFATLLKVHGQEASPATIHTLIQEKTRHYTEYIQKNLVIFPGVVEFVDAASQHYPLAIASGALRHEIEIILDIAGIRKAFRTIVSAEDVSEGKPDPEGFLKALSRLRELTSLPICAEDCLVIEDSIAGLVAARRAGMRCLAVTNTYPRERLAEADQVISSLENCRLDDLSTLFTN